MPWWQRTDVVSWATSRQLARAHLYGPTGIILGAAHGRLLRHNGPEHLLIVASTQSGKTTNLVYPNLLSLPGSLFIFDPKEELYPDTWKWRSTFSRVVHLDPTSSASHRYNLLDGIPLRQDGEIAQAQLVGEMLTDPDSRGADRQSGNSRHFTEMAAEAVAGLTLYGLYTQRARSLAALNALIRQVPFLTLLQQMQRYPHPAIQRVASTLLQTDSRDERSGIFSTLSRTLRLYTDPLIARMTDTSDWTLRDLRERAQPMSLYLTVPFRHLERVRPWTRMVARQCFDHATSRKGGWTWPLLGLMDEFPSLKRMTSLTDGLNTWAGYGVRLMLITPSMEELIDVYGIHHHFYEGCKVQIIFGMYDPKVADTFSARVGQTEVKRQRPIGRGQWVTERVKEPLCSPTMLMNLPDQQSLVIVGKHKVLAQKTYYKDNPVWLERSLL